MDEKARTKALKEASAVTLPSAFLDYRIYIDSLYNYIKNKVEGYSYQKFAEDLGYKATTIVHQIVRGYRPLSVAAANRIAEQLNLDTIELRYLVTLVEYCNATRRTKRNEAFDELRKLKSQIVPTVLERDLLEYFGEWYHAVIRELVGIPGIDQNPKQIEKLLNPKVRLPDIRKSLALLERLQFVTRDPETGRLIPTQDRVSTGYKVKGMGLLRFHQLMLDQAKDALSTVEARRRNFGALTLRCSEETAQQIKAMMNIFQTQVLDQTQRDQDGDHIYQLNLQLFPFTVVKGKQ